MKLLKAIGIVSLFCLIPFLMVAMIQFYPIAGILIFIFIFFSFMTYMVYSYLL